MLQSRWMQRVEFALLLFAVLALAGCGRANPPVPQSTSNVGHQAGDGHDHSGWWCGEHGVPESECSQCNSKVAANFQKKGDWCKEHDRAHSQCFLCNPKAKDKYAAMYKAKYGQEPPAMEAESDASEAQPKG